MSAWIANARMYAVTPGIEAAWRGLLELVAQRADIELHYLPYPAPQPLEDLWTRPDLGAAFMCGFPIALGLAPVVPIAAPIPRAPWAGGRAVYCSDLIVRQDATYQRLEDSFGARAGWTVAHSQSGFNAFRQHLLPFRSPQRPRLYREMTGNLVTARALLDAVREARIDIGPLDAYWHLLIRRSEPSLVEGIRVLARTALTPIPCFVAAPRASPEMVGRLRESFISVARHAGFATYREALQIEGFAAVSHGSYAGLLDAHRAALAAGYDRPA